MQSRTIWQSADWWCPIPGLPEPREKPLFNAENLTLSEEGRLFVTGSLAVYEIAGAHEVHPNQVTTWKREAQDGLKAAISAQPPEKVKRVQHPASLVA
jgi:hypothetical protein